MHAQPLERFRMYVDGQYKEYMQLKSVWISTVTDVPDPFAVQ